MEQTESNIFLIENLEELSCRYRLYRIRGLTLDSDDYFKNTQLLTDKLSSYTRSPCHIFRTDEGAYIAQPAQFTPLPETFDLIRTKVRIEQQGGELDLPFTDLDDNQVAMAVRFLQFSMNQSLGNISALWRAKAGDPFYHKQPDRSFQGSDVDLYKGFAMRLVRFENGRIGVCVDTSRKYVAHNPLPTAISPDDFRRFKGSKCLYEYGNAWYEIRLDGRNDLTAEEVILPSGSSLFDDVHAKAAHFKSPHLLRLPRDCAVLTYYTKNGEPRNVPSGLCRRTFRTDHPKIKKFHAQNTLQSPEVKRKEITFVVNKYLRGLRFGNTEMRLTTRPFTELVQRYPAPDLLFGKSKTLSLRDASKSDKGSLLKMGRRKEEFFYSDTAGPFGLKAFDRQYILLPRSVADSYGPKLVEDLKREVEQLMQAGSQNTYDPMVIPYNDNVQQSVFKIGNEILQAVEQNGMQPGYGVVMIPESKSRKAGKEDELANLVMRRMREKDIYVSVIHTATAAQSFEYENGRWSLVQDKRRKGRYRGYIKNVALNKVLLLNQIWPFVLHTPLHSDLIIGIDVKNNMVGFTLIYKNGGDVRFLSHESTEKEQLSREHIKTQLLKILRDEADMLSEKGVRHVTIHRQGRLFQTEKQGIEQAMEELKASNDLPVDATCTLVEIQKNSMIPFRLFNISSPPGSQQEQPQNPWIGTHMMISSSEGVVCTTGQPFARQGTTHPLHVFLVDGAMSLKDVMEDVFFLANLTWTKINDCLRDPLSVKMNDLRLREVAGEFDEEQLEYAQ